VKSKRMQGNTYRTAQ